MRRSPAYFVPMALAFAIVAICGFLQPAALGIFRNLVFDSWQRLQPRAFDADGPVRIIAVDEASLAEFGQWPWPRTRMAEVTRQLTELGAAAISFDIVFGEPDRTSLENLVPVLPAGPARDALAARAADLPSNDRLLAEAMAAGPTVAGTTLIEGPPQPLPPKAGFVTAGDDPAPWITAFSGAAAPLPEIAKAAHGIGATNWLPDRDQVIRRVPLIVKQGDMMLPSLAVEALRVAQGASTIIIRASNASGEGAFGRETGVNTVKVGDRAIETGPHADVRPYYTPTESARIIPIADVIHGKVDRAEIEGRIILVGTTAIGLGDVRATPLDPAVAGVEIQAQILENLVGGTILARPDWAAGAEFVAAILLFLAIALALPSLTPSASAMIVAILIAGCGVASFAIFDRAKLLFDPAFPALSTLAAYVVGTLSLWQAERRSRKQVRVAFGKFLAPAVVDRLAADPRGLVLGGETRELTVMFSDLRNFSGLSEGLDAQALTHFMNAYLTPMTDAILDEHGTIDKYIGDAIVAFWNAPLDVPDHAIRAVNAALKMRAALAAFNEARIQDARAKGETALPAAMGIGLNLGPCTVGNMGSLRRFDYSVLGDTVNLASRLEGVSKIYGVDIIASQALAEQTPHFAWLELDRVRVKGRREATTIFGVAGDEVFGRTLDFARWREAQAAMLARFRAGDVSGAIADAMRLRDETPPAWSTHYEAMAQRFGDVAQEPHALEKDAIRVLDSK